MATTSYVEIGFVQSAGVLFAFDNIAGSQEIQLRLSNYSSTMWNTSQTDDYSFVACGAGSTDFVARAKMPGFYMGQPAWGTTPP